MRRTELDALIKLAQVVKALGARLEDHDISAEAEEVVDALESITADDCGEEE